jgi:hypothetical protein
VPKYSKYNKFIGSAQELAYILCENPGKIGVLVVGNAGRPGGSIGEKDGSGITDNAFLRIMSVNTQDYRN